MRPTLVLVLLALATGCGHPEPKPATVPGDDAPVAETSMTEDSTPEPPAGTADATDPGDATDTPDKIERSDDEWRERLTRMEYWVMREQGTERAFTGEYWNTTTAGTYHCRACDAPLFVSDAKFESGCGWPSFFEPLENAWVMEKRDSSHGMIRTEVVCGRCDAHLGHVFNDGPKPTGLRYCINSLSIRLHEAGDDEAAGDDADDGTAGER